MTFRPSEAWGLSNYFGSPKTLFPLKITFESDQIARKYPELAPDPRPTIPSRLTCDADGDKKVLWLQYDFIYTVCKKVWKSFVLEQLFFPWKVPLATYTLHMCDRFSFCRAAKLWWKHSFAFKAAHKLSARLGKCVKAMEIRPRCGNLYPQWNTFRNHTFMASMIYIWEPMPWMYIGKWMRLHLVI